MADFYDVLGISRDSSADAIHSRYRFLAKAYHPDRFSNAEEKAHAEEEMKRINEAFATLSNTAKRAEYDRRKFSPSDDSTPNKTNTDTSEYLSSLEDYFLGLLRKWDAILYPPESSEELGKAIDQTYEGLVMLMRELYPSPAHPQAKEAIEYLQKILMMMIYMNLALGAEISTAGLPAQYKLMEMEVFTCIPFYEQVYGFANKVKQKKPYRQDSIENIINHLVELSLLITSISVNIGQLRAKNKDSGERSFVWREQSTSKPEEKYKTEPQGYHGPAAQPTKSRVGWGWRFALISVICIVSYSIMVNSNNQGKNSNSSPGDPPSYNTQKTPTKITAILPRKTATPTPKDKDNCVSFSSVTADDEGKVLCVSGLVAKAYFGDNNEIFYITFSNDANDFRFIVMDGHYYEVKQGNCVQATGTVKKYGEMPYIEVTDELWNCAPSR